MRNSAMLCATSVPCGAGAWRGVLRLPPANREVGECTGVHMLTRICFDEKIDCGSQGKNVEDVTVVVSPFRPRMGEVQELKREIRTVRRENSGGNEVLQEANTLLSVEPLFV